MAKCIRVGMKDGLGQSMAAGEVGACEIIVDSRSLTYGIWCRITLAYHPIYYTPTRSELVYLLHTIKYIHTITFMFGAPLKGSFWTGIFLAEYFIA